MNLSEFIELTETAFDGKEHHVTFSMSGTNQRGGVYVKGASSEYEAKERAFLYLKELIESGPENKSTKDEK